MTLIIVILVFGGMVFIHEFGHFLAARFFNIEVEEFGFGFPPKVMTLFKWKGTEFTLKIFGVGVVTAVVLPGELDFCHGVKLTKKRLAIN